MRKERRLNIRPTLLAGAVLMVLSELAAAQEAAVLPEVNVKTKAASEADNVISAEALEKWQAKDVREALQGEAGVSVGGGGNPITQKIYVRGIEETMLNVSVDGAQQNGYIYHHQARIQLDPALINSIEIEKGPSATAGPGALAGAIRVTTKDATDLLRAGQTSGFMVGGTSSSNNGWKGQGAVYGKFGEVADIIVAATKQDTGNYKDGNGETLHMTASEIDSAFVKGNWYLAPGQTLTFSHNRIKDSGARFIRPHMIDFAANNNTPFGHTLERDTTTVAYRLKGRDHLPDLELSAYNDDNTNMRTDINNRFGGSRTTWGENLISRGVDATLTSRMGMHTLQYGLNYNQGDSKAVNPRYVGLVPGNSGKETTDVAGLFLEGRIELNRQWRLALGGRYDWFDYEDNFGQTFKSDGFSPSTSLSFAATDKLSLRAGYAEALRGIGRHKEAFHIDNPRGDGVTAAPPNRLYRNSPDLKEERAHNVEVGADYSNGAWLVRGTLFKQTIDNAITTDVIGGVSTFVNGEQIVSKGYELSVGWHGQDLQVTAALAHSKPRKENGDPLTDSDFGFGTAVGRSLSLRADYAISEKVGLAWTGRMVEKIKQHFEDGSVTTKKGYDVHDLVVSWAPLGKDQLKLSLGVYNLFDKYYFDQASYIGVGDTIYGFAEPGRDVRVSANWKF